MVIIVVPCEGCLSMHISPSACLFLQNAGENSALKCAQSSGVDLMKNGAL
ncbi:hypothetical protein KCP74_09455 [Salmonella enterica subsp. enterica]|nr:hypothetical protein KCP74_09455 [Salmonella enterica subsp. enterica]